MPDSGSEPQLPVRHAHEGKQVVLYSVLIVLDDFAQRQDDVSVLGMVKVGWAKLRCLAG